jgi:Zn-dependent protease
MSIIPATLCFTVHESAHGLAAYALGDDTARREGRITLNPLRHIDPIGLLLLATVGFGWAKPVMVNPRSFKKPKWGMALTSLAGPLSNFIFAGICWIVLPFIRVRTATEPMYYVFALVYLTMRLNIGLGLFNMIPIPPLDGSKVFFAFLPEEKYFRVTGWRHGFLVLIIGMLIWNYLPSILRTLTSMVR